MIRISVDAAQEIEQRLDKHKAISDESLPLLLWACRTYTTLESGEIIEHGPKFFVYSTSDLEEDMYIVTQLPTGRRLALGPKDVFIGGNCEIVFQGGNLVLLR